MVYGDLGVHSESMAHLHLDAMKGKYSAVLHVGDFGYNLYDTITEGQFAGKNVSLRGSDTVVCKISRKSLIEISLLQVKLKCKK